MYISSVIPLGSKSQDGTHVSSRVVGTVRRELSKDRRARMGNRDRDKNGTRVGCLFQRKNDTKSLMSVSPLLSRKYLAYQQHGIGSIQVHASTRKSNLAQWVAGCSSGPWPRHGLLFIYLPGHRATDNSNPLGTQPRQTRWSPPSCPFSFPLFLLALLASTHYNCDARRPSPF
jgi:hypothetical protein